MLRFEVRNVGIIQLPNFDSYYPVVGAWVIGGEAAGIFLREDEEIVTQDLSIFVPHYFT